MTESVASPTLWVVTLGAVLGLLALDFAMTRRPHAVRMREAAAWSGFYLAIALSFGAFVWGRFGADAGTAYLTGYLVERSLSVDNLFLFMLLLSAFAVPAHMQQRVLLYGIVGALVLRGAFIALGAVALAAFDWTFLAFGVLLLLTAGRILRGALRGTEHAVEPDQMRSVRLVRRFVPVTPDYKGTRLLGRVDGRRALTPLALTVAAVIGTDIVFAIDSVPAVYGITEDPYLVFAANAFALLGLRALYFLLAGSLSKLVYLNFGLAAILAFIGTKLALHWAHVQWPSVPQVPDQSSIVVVTAILAVTTLTSLRACRRNRASKPERPNAAADAPQSAEPDRDGRRVSTESTGRPAATSARGDQVLGTPAEKTRK